MAALTDADLYVRGTETVLASWEAYTLGSRGAAVFRGPGVAAAVFPSDPERAFYNNALLGHGLGSSERADALDAMQAAYESAAVTRFAAWVHESDVDMRRDLEARRYALDGWTRAMGMELRDIARPRPEVELAPPSWPEYLRIVGVPRDLLSGVDRSVFHVLVARVDGESVATAMAFDHDGDCGIYNVSTIEQARRRGLGTALTALHVHAALERGCRTASLQATASAEGIYAAVGFRDLGRILEYVPSSSALTAGAAGPSATASAAPYVALTEAYDSNPLPTEAPGRRLIRPPARPACGRGRRRWPSGHSRARDPGAARRR
jgi:ribosomal protein S18 acetylase RimI-like enzyme